MSDDAGRRRNVHPFPARMAPEIALAKIEGLTSLGAVVLDPMCGSGTVPRLALQQDRQAIASDVDPLAVMMTRTTCKPAWSKGLAARAKEIVRLAQLLDDSQPEWIASDPDSIRFVDYWFALEQQRALRRLARVLCGRPISDDPLRVALSRLIVTKDGGASLARDTSHSRPHRVRTESDFDVYAGFLRAAQLVETLVVEIPTSRRASIRSVDARGLDFVRRSSVDLILTSPPYLNAIDYLRGHRMSLVWLGWKFSDLRSVRSESVGAERSLATASGNVRALAQLAIPRLEELTPRNQHMVYRFTRDVERLCRSFARVTKRGGHLVFVVADSQLKGVPVSNSYLCQLSAVRAGFHLEETVARTLPSQHRYLPPPDGGAGAFAARMREERILTFIRS